MYRCESPTCHSGCAKPTLNNFKRTAKEAKGWHPLMPIALCEKHAKKRIPLTEKKLNNIMKQIFPKLFYPMLMLCLSFLGCSAQTVETLKSISKPGSVLITGPNENVIGVDPSILKGEKGERGDQGLPGVGLTGPQGLPGKDGMFTIPDGAKDWDVLMVMDGKLIAVGANIAQDFGYRDSLTTSVNLSYLLATRDMYSIAIAGDLTGNGTLDVKYKYTDRSGRPELGTITINKMGAFNPAHVSIHPKKGTPIELYTETRDQIFYNIAFNIHQQ